MMLNQVDAPVHAPEPLRPPTFAPRLPPAPARRPATPPVAGPGLIAPSMYATQRAVIAPAPSFAPAAVRSITQPVGSSKRSRGRRVLNTTAWLIAVAAIGAGCVLGFKHVSQPVPAGVAAESSDAPVLPDLTFLHAVPRVVSYVRTTRLIGVVDGSTIATNAVVTAEVDYVTPIASVELDMTTAGERTQEHVILTPDSAYRDGTAEGGTWERIPRPATSTVSADSAQLVRFYQDVVTPAVRKGATHVTVRRSADAIPIRTYEFDVPLSLLADDELLPEPVDLSIADGLLKPELITVHVAIAIDPEGLIRVEDIQADERSWREAIELLPGGFPMLVHDRFEVTSTSETALATTVPASFVDAIDAEPGTLNELCEIEKRTLEVAIEAWFALHPDSAVPTERQLVDEELLLIEVPGYDITPDGDLIPAAGSPCG